MHVKELDKLLSKVADALRANEKAATPEFLQMVELVCKKIKETPSVFALLASLTGSDVNTLYRHMGSVEEFLAMEKGLLEDGTSAKLIQVVERLRDSPLLMRGIALLV